MRSRRRWRMSRDTAKETERKGGTLKKKKAIGERMRRDRKKSKRNKPAGAEEEKKHESFC